jgi:hypothetical protein
MTAALTRTNNNAARELTQFIEPLAEYITAADRPREALLSALQALFDEVQGTHRATLMHLARTHADSLGLAL